MQLQCIQNHLSSVGTASDLPGIICVTGLNLLQVHQTPVHMHTVIILQTVTSYQKPQMTKFLFFPCLCNLPGGEGMAGVEGIGMCVGNGSTIYEVLKTDKLSAWVLTDEKNQPTTACSAS